MYSLLRPLLFRLDPETAHQLALRGLRFAGNFPLSNWLLTQLYKTPSQPVRAFGLTFKNPVGLAAGYDRDGIAIRGLSALGFGHIEIGTITPQPHPGNPTPRLFRLIEDEAVIDRMGSPSRGSEFVQMRMNPSLRAGWFERTFGIQPSGQKRKAFAPRRGSVILGINIGRNKETPNEQAVLDYLALLQNFAPYADYLAINVSSPDTAGLRQLQAGESLRSLLGHLHAQRKIEEGTLQKKIPLLVKLSPDLTSQELDEAMDVILQTRMDGIIATSTTLTREGLRSRHRDEAGGLSGAPLRVQSEAVLRQAVRRVDGRIPIISVGGIMTPDDARRRLDMGAALIQVYTGLIYHGPGLVKKILGQ